jgi:TolB-like protein
LIQQRHCGASEKLSEKAFRDAEASEEPAAVQSVAALPFKPLGRKEEDVLLGMGMADAVITRLS